jgi:CheY-like chemotaxis protein
VLFIGAETADKTNFVLHRRLVSDLVPALERLAEELASHSLPATPTTAPQFLSNSGATNATSIADNNTAANLTAPREDLAAIPLARAVPNGQIAQVTAPKPVSHLQLAIKPQRTRLSALVVDDSPTVRTQLALTVERMGLKCDTAESAAAAFELLKSNSYSLIYVDVIMPEMDGYKLTREIRRDPMHKSTPVIILTSQSSPFDRARGALSGCDTFLTKPVDLKRFYEATVRTLRKRLAIDDLTGWVNDPTLPVATPAPIQHAPSNTTPNTQPQWLREAGQNPRTF